MKVTMDMSSFEIEYEASEAEYDDEVLNSGWNPEIDTVSLQLQLVPVEEHLAMPEGLATEAVESFLRKMYYYQR